MGNGELSKHKVAYMVTVDKNGDIHITKCKVAYINSKYTYLIAGKNQALDVRYTDLIKPSLSDSMKSLKADGQSVAACVNHAYWDISDTPKITEKILKAEIEYDNDVRQAELAVSRLIEAKAYLSNAEEELGRAKERLKKYQALKIVEPKDAAKYQEVEIFDIPALFSNGRIAPADMPDGLYRYDLRGSDDDPGMPVTIEPNVAVNHAGTIITAKPLDLGTDNRRYLTEDEGLNFVGGEISMQRFFNERQKSRNTEEVESRSIVE